MKRIHQQRSTSPQFIVPLQNRTASSSEIVTEPFSLAILITRLDSREGVYLISVYDQKWTKSGLKTDYNWIKKGQKMTKI